MNYNIKKTWFHLSISFLLCSISGIIISFFTNNNFKTAHFILDSITYSMFIFNIAMYFIIKIADNSNHSITKKIKYHKQIDCFFEETGKFFFPNKEPKINYYYLMYIFLFVLFCFLAFCFYVFFIAELNTDNIKNNVTEFIIGFVLLQVSFISFTWYFIQPIINKIVIKILCYKLKKPIYNNCYFYLNTNREAFILKNGILHCDRLPAYTDNFYVFENESEYGANFLTYKKLKAFSEKELEERYQLDSHEQKRTWYLNGKKIELPNTDYQDQEIRDLIKIKNSAINF